MAESLLINSRSVVANAGITTYVAVAGQLDSITLEASAQMPVRDSGTAKNAFVIVTANSTTSNSTVTLRVSGAGSSLQVVIGAGVTGVVEDISNTVALANTDLICWELLAGTVGSITFQVISMQFTPDAVGDCVSLMGTHGNYGHTTASVTRYSHISGSTTAADSSDALTKYRIRGTFTAKNLFVYLFSNTRTTDTTFQTRVNGAAGSQAVTFGSLVSGSLEDAANTDALVDGDDLQFAIITGAGAGTCQVRPWAVTLVNQDDLFILLASRQTSQSINSALTRYNSCKGILLVATIENAAEYPRFDFTAKNLGAYATTNTLNGNTVISLNKNGSSSSLTVTFGSAVTGLLEDTSNTVQVLSGTDSISYKMETAGSSGAIGLTWIGMLGQEIPPAPPGTDSYAKVVTQANAHSMLGYYFGM